MSIKRKNDSDHDQQVKISYASTVSGDSLAQAEHVSQDSILEEEIVKVRSLCDKFTTEVANPNIDPALIPILSTMAEAFNGICAVQSKLAARSIWKPVINTHQVTNAVPAKKPRNDPSQSNFVDLATLKSNSNAIQVSNANHTPTPADNRLKKFKESVQAAEKSTLIFNLNLGNVPIMNVDTMSTRATMALSELAAKVEKKTGKIPSEETQATLEDVLSVATGIHFFGRKTKSVTNNRDNLSGAYCTLPVRYDFKDKEDRFEAESVLRDKCKIQCATPYPTILREAIRQVWDAVKVDYPDNYIRVKVDTSDMSLKVARRPMVETAGKKIWTNVGSAPIPEACLDTGSKTVPEGFKVFDIPRKHTRKSSVESGSSSDLDSTMHQDTSSPVRSKSKSPSGSGSGSAAKGEKQKQSK
jgi:hypothetical protein